MPVLQHYEDGFQFEQEWLTSDQITYLLSFCPQCQVTVVLDAKPFNSEMGKRPSRSHRLVALNGHRDKLAQLHAILGKASN